MKNVLFLLALATLMTALGRVPARSQAPTGEIRGTVSDSSKPLAGATVTLANVYSGKSFKIKTDDFGNFVIQDAPYGYYDLDVTSADGDRLLHQQISIMPAGSSRTATVKIDVSQSKTTSAVPNDPDTYGGIRVLPEPKIKNKKKLNQEIQKQNEKVSETNALILQANAAVLD